MLRRLDSELVRRGLVPSRTEARAAIQTGLVTAGGRRVSKPSTLVGSDEALNLAGEARRFVSRGGEKLDAALDRFGLRVEGFDCLDAGASTGGFTDCLLARGAARVAAIDVGYGQLAWSLRQDERVTVRERTNVRNLRRDDLPFVPNLIVADLSFISLTKVIPTLVSLASGESGFVVLVKPQFEAGPDEVGKGGVVRDPQIWANSIRAVEESFRVHGVFAEGVVASALKGPAGNVEFFLQARPGGDGLLDLDDALEEARAIGGVQ
ncbi:MAG: TlyA family RNA methyltransferase [Actinomycetota bacterium]